MGQRGDFNYVDFVASQFTENDESRSKVIFVPSGRIANPGGACVTISYPGSDLMVDYSLGNHPKYAAYLPPFD